MAATGMYELDFYLNDQPTTINLRETMHQPAMTSSHTTKAANIKIKNFA